MKKTDDLDTLVKLAMELQAISQNGLTYTKDLFDKDRFERVREISAEIMSMKTGISVEKVKDVFCNETGYQTPKVDTRAAIFEENRILLVKEQGKWSLPGGWVDFNESIASNTVKEVREEAGLEVIPQKIIAVQERNRRHSPAYAYGILTVFVLCAAQGGCFQPNDETTESGYFLLNELPVLDERKTVYSQICMCFDAAGDEQWKTQFD